MKITADTNLLVRAIVGDDSRQSPIAKSTLARAELVAITVPALCEFVWVLSQGYGIALSRIAETLRLLIDTANVSVNRSAVEAGLAMLDRGGDFADGVIANEGRWLGGETFISFDRKAIKLISAEGIAAKLPQELGRPLSRI